MDVEGIVSEFDEKFKQGMPPMKIHNTGPDSWVEHPEIKDWLRTKLTQLITQEKQKYESLYEKHSKENYELGKAHGIELEKAKWI